MNSNFMKILLLCLALFGAAAAARAAAALSPAPKVLILYDTLGASPRTRVATELALASPAPVVDSCQCSSASGGIQAALTTCGYQLSSYCQVWDLRFANNSGASGTVADDTFTTSGANNDEQLYTAFLAQGGSLYLMADNSDFHSRNDGLIQMLTDWSNAGPLSYPNKGGTCCTVFPGDPYNWATTPNVLTNTNATAPGSIPLTALGSGRPLATFLFSGTTNSANQIGFLPQDLTTKAGRVLASLDFNMLGSGWSAPLGNPYIDNSYTWLGNCQTRYTASKSASTAGPVGQGSSFNYLVCVQNTGSVPLSGLAFDTLPGCVTYVSSTPAYNTRVGNYFTWNLGSVALGASACVTVTVQATSLPPCP
jgi:hypothetical protein